MMKNLLLEKTYTGYELGCTLEWGTSISSYTLSELIQTDSKIKKRYLLL